MEKFWSEYLSDSQSVTNCKLVTKDGMIKETHRILLAAISDFLKTLLADTFEEEDSYVYLPDFSMQELEECFETIFYEKEENSSNLYSILGIRIRNSSFKCDDEGTFKAECDIDKLNNIIEEPIVKVEENQDEFDEIDNLDDFLDEEPLSDDDTSRPFKCSICSKPFTALRRLKHHITCTHEKMKGDFEKHFTKVDGGLYECKLCKKVCDHISKFKKHMKRAHALGAKYKCDTCERPFCYEEELEKHNLQCEKNLTAAESKKYQCAKCGKRLTKPRMKHKCMKIIVGDADVIFSTNGNVPNNSSENENTFVKLEDDELIGDDWAGSDTDEMQEKFNTVITVPKEIDDSDYLQCEHCDQKCKNKNMLKAHITIRHPEKSEQLKYILEVDGMFQCSICSKKFKRRSKCNYHVKIFHKIGAKLECKVCKKPFYYEYDMNIHMKTHNESKAAYCDLCGKGFSGKHVLKAHVISAHSSKQEKESARSHFCSICAKGFFSNGALKEHELLHGDTKNFHCTQCPKTFKQSSGLRAHVKRWHSEAGVPFMTEAQKARMAAYMVKYRAEKKAKKTQMLHY